MSTRFSQQFTRMGAPLLVRQFGETIFYYSGGTGTPREIMGIVERDVQVITDESIPALATFITVKNDATLGITSTEIDTGRDKVSIPIRVGESVQIRQVTRVDSTENGLVRFEVN